MIQDFDLGDVVQMKKQHPCGNKEWTIIRIGADIKIRCNLCKRIVMLDRAVFCKRAVKIIRKNKE